MAMPIWRSRVAAKESISPICLAGFGNLGATSEIDRSGSGIDAVRREIAAVLFLARARAHWVLESLEHAVARGATILAEVAGFGSTGDAHHMTAPEPSGEGAVRAMRQALAEGGFTPDDLGHLNAHGTSTQCQ